MSQLIEKFSDFLKPHLVSVELRPTIEVDYGVFSHELESQYRKKWEELLAVIDPKTIESRTTNDYRSGSKQETLLVNFDGVMVKLKGAYYDAPVVRRSGDEPKQLSQQEQADLILSGIFGPNPGYYGGVVANIVWALQHGTKEKVDTTLSMLATAAGRDTGVSDEVVQKAADKVVTMLRLAKDLKV